MCSRTNPFSQASPYSPSPEVVKTVGRKVQWLLLLNYAETGCLLSRLAEDCNFFYGEDLVPRKVHEVEHVCRTMLEDYVTVVRDLDRNCYVRPKSFGLAETKKVIEELVVPYLERRCDKDPQDYDDSKHVELPVNPALGDFTDFDLFEFCLGGLDTPDTYGGNYNNPTSASQEISWEASSLAETSPLQCSSVRRDLSGQFAVCTSQTGSAESRSSSSLGQGGQDEGWIQVRENENSRVDLSVQSFGERLPTVSAVPALGGLNSSADSSVDQNSMSPSSQSSSTLDENSDLRMATKRRCVALGRIDSHCAVKFRNLGEPGSSQSFRQTVIQSHVQPVNNTVNFRNPSTSNCVVNQGRKMQKGFKGKMSKLILRDSIDKGLPKIINDIVDLDGGLTPSPSQSPSSIRNVTTASWVSQLNLFEEAFRPTGLLPSNDFISDEPDRGSISYPFLADKPAKTSEFANNGFSEYNLEQILNKKDRYIRQLTKGIRYQLEIRNVANWTCVVSSGCAARFFFICSSNSKRNVTFKSWKDNREWKWVAVPHLHLPQGTVIYGEILNCATSHTVLNIIDVLYVGGENVGDLEFSARRNKCKQYFRQCYRTIPSAYNIVCISTFSLDQLAVVLYDVHNHSDSFSIKREDILHPSTQWLLFNFQVNEILFLKVEMASVQSIASFRSVMGNRLCWKWISGFDLGVAAKNIQHKGKSVYSETLLAYMRKNASVE